MPRLRRFALLLLGAILLISSLSGCVGDAPATMTSLTIWHYYNSDQQETFNTLVEEFNATLGAQERITVLAYNQGGINDLAEKSLSALTETSSESAPDLFAAYADVAYEADQLGLVADLTPYFTEEELASYLPDYLHEGMLGGKLKLFPIAKCSELLFLNETEWAAFSAATGVEKSQLTTWEGVAAVAEQYYLWTDSLTPDVAEDGRAFFGRDAFANYMLVGSTQLGAPLFDPDRGEGMEVVADEAVMGRLWENYYIPYVNGYYADYGRFRSDDLRTGMVASYVGSSSGTGHFPGELTLDDGSTTPIEGWVTIPPNFQDTAPMAVQQGAGLVVTASTPERERAAATFLKWFTAPEQNAQFAISASYTPVTAQGNAPAVLDQAVASAPKPVSPLVREGLTLTARLPLSHFMYAPAPFLKELAVRQVANFHLPDAAKEGRAQVLALMEGGLSRGDAVAQVTTPEAFQDWYASFQTALEAARQ